MELDNYIKGVTSSPSTQKLDADLIKAQLEFKPIKKSGRNEYAGFDYSTLADICTALLPALLKHGFPMPRFQTGFMGGELVMVGKLTHTSGEWISCVLPMRDQIDKNGNRREDNQSMESASTYCRKQLFLQLAGGWSVGAEDMEQAEEAVSQVNAEVAKEKEPPAPVKAQDFYRRLETKMRMVKSVPAELEKCFVQAESLAQTGDMTADQLAKLTRQFGALRPKQKEVANAL